MLVSDYLLLHSVIRTHMQECLPLMNQRHPFKVTSPIFVNYLSVLYSVLYTMYALAIV
jgi:hypothetical protein